MKLFKSLFFLLLCSSLSYAQQGGMWIPSLLEGFNETEMERLGSTLSASDIYNVNQKSMKDGIVHFDGGCTSEIISPKGLLLTNHHCGFDAIQSHSSVDRDYLDAGFWANSLEEELANPEMTATIIERIEDVTTQVMQGTKKTNSDKEFQNTIAQNIKKLIDKTPKESWQEVEIRSFFKGNQYVLFVNNVFKDIRLVGAPPSAIGAFGSDTDNWVWPRHTGDFSLFRIYADKNNNPAAYSEDNIPYVPKHYFPISLDGVEEDDFTMIFGFPGRTDEYLPAIAIDQTVHTLNPVKIAIREESLKITDDYMRKNKRIKLKYASKYADIANYWKKWIGENQGIEKSNAIAKRKEKEKLFAEKVAKKKKYKAYRNILPDFEKEYKAIEEVALARDYWVETVYWNVEILNTAYRLYQLSNSVDSPNFEAKKTETLKLLKNKFKDYSTAVDRDVFLVLMEKYQKEMPSPYIADSLKTFSMEQLTSDVFTKSKLTTLYGVEKLLEGDAKQVMVNLNNDVGFQLGKSLNDTFFNSINPKYQEGRERIARLQREYMKALMEVFPNDRFYPDANSTLRITYGKVKGYQPKDGVYYTEKTYLDGIVEKYVPGDYEFDVPEKLLDLYAAKDFGEYAENGKIPVNFIGTNHTTGGNSGSPAIDAKGNLIGLNFDRVWEGTMSDINYDPEICRNIMVDVRFILFIIDKFADADHLIEEMTLVHPKK